MSEETKEAVSGYISKLHFNDGSTLDVEKNDIVVFVGPNNAGKSQALKDIYALSSKKVSPIVISDITITKTTGSLAPLLEKIAVGNNQGSYITYSLLGHNMTYWGSSSEDVFLSDAYYEGFRDLFVANLDTAARLTICKPPNTINRNDAKTHPIHYAAFDGKYRKWLSDSFKKAFSFEVIPNTQHGATIPLCIGNPVKLADSFRDEQERLEKYAEVLDGYKHIQNQGDGIKSFTGILLYLMLDYYRTYLIDEPESFLHPPQARIMGQTIGTTLSDQQQAFISTHSEDIIKGLLEACPERIKIVRITRDDDTNFFSILNHASFNDVWNDPLLKYSNIMSSLFHKSVVLCESDSDCKMYSIVENHLKQSMGKYSETLFIHCGGKHRMAKIAAALCSLNISVKLIPDIDVLNDEKVIKGIAEAVGISWDAVSAYYNTVVSNLHSPKEHINREEAKTSIDRILSASADANLSEAEIKSIRTVISTESKWKFLKFSGISAIPPGDATNAYKQLDRAFREKGIYIVSVGVLECFIKEVGGHGPGWANEVLEKYPDLNDAVYAGIKEFVSGLKL